MKERFEGSTGTFIPIEETIKNLKPWPNYNVWIFTGTISSLFEGHDHIYSLFNKYENLEPLTLVQQYWNLFLELFWKDERIFFDTLSSLCLQMKFHESKESNSRKSSFFFDEKYTFTQFLDAQDSNYFKRTQTVFKKTDQQKLWSYEVLKKLPLSFLKKIMVNGEMIGRILSYIPQNYQPDFMQRFDPNFFRTIIKNSSESSSVLNSLGMQNRLWFLESLHKDWCCERIKDGYSLRDFLKHFEVEEQDLIIKRLGGYAWAKSLIKSKEQQKELFNVLDTSLQKHFRNNENSLDKEEMAYSFNPF